MKFDLSSLNELLGNDEDALKDILRAFVTDYEKYVKDLEDGVIERDFEKIKKNAHAMKSVVGNFNLKELYDYASDMERRAKENLYDGMNELFEKFKDGLIKFRDWIEETYQI
ncbi:TPA: hypothetical protein DCW38_06645 [candidate division WOR-3 bacterium]|jgi:HPt (histidine-containing phosphotransfer) domain-containing protein|uniref:HPt domain-containing protein n=1 Tax=candidate division WOR-3 bacterium TaxID=2052148 RepID=A0A350HBC5_UNCW3|nr:hypothetical protein [candidate division WOR-3 bacterium]